MRTPFRVMAMPRQSRLPEDSPKGAPAAGNLSGNWRVTGQAGYQPSWRNLCRAGRQLWAQTTWGKTFSEGPVCHFPVRNCKSSDGRFHGKWLTGLPSIAQQGRIHPVS